MKANVFAVAITALFCIAMFGFILADVFQRGRQRDEDMRHKIVESVDITVGIAFFGAVHDEPGWMVTLENDSQWLIINKKPIKGHFMESVDMYARK